MNSLRLHEGERGNSKAFLPVWSLSDLAGLSMSVFAHAAERSEGPTKRNLLTSTGKGKVFRVTSPTLMTNIVPENNNPIILGFLRKSLVLLLLCFSSFALYGQTPVQVAPGVWDVGDIAQNALNES